MTALARMPAGVLGRALAWSMLCALIALGYLAAVVPLIELYHSGEATLTDRQLLVPKLERLAAEVPMLRTRLAELQTATAGSEVTLDGASDALASANLQSRLEQLAAANGVTIASTEAIAAESRGPYRRIGLRVAVNGNYEAIVKLLAAIQEAAPPLILANLQIHGLFRAVAIRTSYPLESRFEVYGLRVGEAKPAAPP
ncbi:MAG: type II secretion system protein GspM [Stellaceae bacterium]